MKCSEIDEGSIADKKSWGTTEIDKTSRNDKTRGLSRVMRLEKTMLTSLESSLQTL